MASEPDVYKKIVDHLPNEEEYIILNDLVNLILPTKKFIKAQSSQKRTQNTQA